MAECNEFIIRGILGLVIYFKIRLGDVSHARADNFTLLLNHIVAN